MANLQYTSESVILTWFETDDFPTQKQFAAAWTSYWHKGSLIPQSSIDGLEQTLRNYQSNEQFNIHLNDALAHNSTLALLDASNLTAEYIAKWKELFQITYLATIDGGDEIGNVYSKPQIDETIKGLENYFDGFNRQLLLIKEILKSDDIDLDELQEIVDLLKKNKEQIELLHEISTEGITDEKIGLVADYPDWGVSKQNQFNDVVFDKLKYLDGDFEATIVSNITLTHNLKTWDVGYFAYDTVTGYDAPLRFKRINENSVDIQFDDQPLNAIKIKIRKL